MILVEFFDGLHHLILCCRNLCGSGLANAANPFLEPQTSGTWVKIAVEVGQVLRLF
jgi:hypothetical protein